VQLKRDCIVKQKTLTTSVDRPCKAVTADQDMCNYIHLFKDVPSCYSDVKTSCTQQDNAAYRLQGTGWCQVSPNKRFGDTGNVPPAFYKKGATQADLQDLCDQFEDCNAIQFGNTGNGYLLFTSVAAIDAVAVPSGYTKWVTGCQFNCRVTSAAVPANAKTVGECWKKKEIITYAVVSGETAVAPSLVNWTVIGVAVGITIVLMLGIGATVVVVVVLKGRKETSADNGDRKATVVVTNEVAVPVTDDTEYVKPPVL